jgi:hypothetical protein
MNNTLESPQLQPPANESEFERMLTSLEDERVENQLNNFSDKTRRQARIVLANAKIVAMVPQESEAVATARRAIDELISPLKALEREELVDALRTWSVLLAEKDADPAFMDKLNEAADVINETATLDWPEAA